VRCQRGIISSPIDQAHRFAPTQRQHGISEATLYNLKPKYGGMDVSDAKRACARWKTRSRYWTRLR